MSKYPGRNYGSITNQPNGGGDKKAGLASRATHYFIANATASNYYTQTAHPKFNFHLKCSNQLGGVGNIKGHQTSAIADGQRNCGEGCEFILDNENSTFMKKDTIAYFSTFGQYAIEASGNTISGENVDISLTGLLPIVPATSCIWNHSVIQNLGHGNDVNNLEVSGNPVCTNKYYSMFAILVVEGSPDIIKNKLINNGFKTTPNSFSSPPIFVTNNAYILESNQNMEISFCGERHGARQGPFILNGHSDISYIQDTSHVGINPHIIALIYNKITAFDNQPYDINSILNYSYLYLFWYSNEFNYNKIINEFPSNSPQFNNIYKFNLKLA